FTSDSLYGLLVAEIAGSRQQYDVALKNYVQQARQTRDPQVAARATMIARYINAAETSLEMSLLWVETDPKSKDALANAAQSLMHAGRLTEAFEMAKRLHIQGGDAVYQHIAASANRLTKPQRERLLQNYKNLLPRYSREEQLLVGIGLLLQQQGKFDEAMTYARKVLTQYPDSIPAAILEANLLHELKRDREAITKMGKLLSLYPDNTSLRNQYAHILTHYDLALAQQQFSILSEQLPNDADTILSLGIVAVERKDYRVAKKAFERLLDSDKHVSTAHYYLGRLAESQQDSSDAIFNYLQVERGNDFWPATTNLLDIFIRKGDFLSAQQHMNRVRIRVPEESENSYLFHSQALIKYKFLNEAERVLNDSLQAHINSTKLLFARAMLHSSRRQVAEAERDLRRILQFEPDNAAALNSLGYLLADTSQRYVEAGELINKALALRPDDPVIIDSLGWLYFRTGNYIAALRELHRAYNAYPGTAVAAHLGEALWVTGAQVEARQIWQDGIRQAPDDPTIPATMKRLKVE
ncbi:MAG: tetratricopeptide repeat protein, partial [Moraxellaceae bacterium]